MKERRSKSFRGCPAFPKVNRRVGEFSRKRGFARRTKILELTAKGYRARDAYSCRTREIEESWGGRKVREALERLAPRLNAIDPWSEGWRASVPKLEGLPHFPMTLRRGGFPDGS